MRNNLKKIFCIFIISLIVFIPASFASQISDLNPESLAVFDEENSLAETNEGNIINEIKIRVSEDGQVTILDSGEEESNVEVNDNTDVFEQIGDSCSDAQSLVLGTRYYQYISPSGDVDWYKWSLPSSGQFTVNLEVPSGLDYDLKVYSTCSTSVCSSTNGAGNDEQCTVDAGSGWIYSKIYGYTSTDYSSTDQYFFKGTFQAQSSYDLYVNDIWTEPSSPMDTGTFNLKFTIQNQGSDDIASSFTDYVYVNNNYWSYCDHDSGVVSGGGRTCTWSNLQWNAGTYTIKVVTDIDNDIQETNEGNNERQENIIVGHTAQYDLVPGSFTITPSSPDDADSITIRYESKNNGPDDITSSYNYKLYIDNALYHTCSSSGRPAGTTGYCEREGISLSAGTYTLKNIVDTENNIAETDENNNVKTQLLVIDPSPFGNDLIVKDIWTEPSNPDDNDLFDLKFSVDNIKPTDIADDFYSRLYLDETLLLNCHHKEGIADGTYRICTKYDVSLAAGDYQLFVITDYYGNIEETDETNNEREEDLHIEQSSVEEHDLVLTDLWTIPANPTENELFDIKFKVKNDELADVTNSFISKLFIGNIPYLICTHDNGIGAGITHICTRESVSLSEGIYTLKAQADYNNNVNENDEYNNIKTKTLIIYGSDCLIPDGSGENCDCDSHYDCPLSSPYCEDEYPYPISEGYDACLETKPKYCGDGICSNGETWQTCQDDCSLSAGRIYADVDDLSGNALSGAQLYLDNSFKGTTNSNGKIDFSADYGNRNVKVNCPDGTYCDTKSVYVDGTEYAYFDCGCDLNNLDNDGDGYNNEFEKRFNADPNNADSNPIKELKKDDDCGSISLYKIITGAFYSDSFDFIQIREPITLELPNDERNESEQLTLFITVNPESLDVPPEEGRGFATGIAHGAVYGLVDDVKFVKALLVGGAKLFFNQYVHPFKTSPDFYKKAVEVTEFIKSLPEEWDPIKSQIIAEVIDSISQKADSINPYEEQCKRVAFNKAFVGGYITGYSAEQLLVLEYASVKVFKAMKAGKLGNEAAKLATAVERMSVGFRAIMANSIVVKSVRNNIDNIVSALDEIVRFDVEWGNQLISVSIKGSFVVDNVKDAGRFASDAQEIVAEAMIKAAAKNADLPLTVLKGDAKEVLMLDGKLLMNDDYVLAFRGKTNEVIIWKRDSITNIENGKIILKQGAKESDDAIGAIDTFAIVGDEIHLYEVKRGSTSGNLMDYLGDSVDDVKNNFRNKKMKPIEELTGKKPRMTIIASKGTTSDALKNANSRLYSLVHDSYINAQVYETPLTNSELLDIGEHIKKAARKLNSG